jgi:hypothetical protein
MNLLKRLQFWWLIKTKYSHCPICNAKLIKLSNGVIGCPDVWHFDVGSNHWRTNIGNNSFNIWYGESESNCRYLGIDCSTNYWCISSIVLCSCNKLPTHYACNDIACEGNDAINYWHLYNPTKFKQMVIDTFQMLELFQ